jgi:hypothetical protein
MSQWSHVLSETGFHFSGTCSSDVRLSQRRHCTKTTAAGLAPTAVTKHRSRRLAKFKTITAQPRYEADARYDVFFIFFFFVGFVGVVAMALFLLSDDPSAGLSFKLAGLARSL